MKFSIPAFAVPLLLVSSHAAAQPPESDEGVPITTLIEQVAEDMDREFVIDPRIRGIMGITTGDDLDYDSLLGILRISGVVAIEVGDQIHVMPDRDMRVAPTRVLQEDDPRVSDHEVITRIIDIPEFPDLRPQSVVNAQMAANPFAAPPGSSAAQLVPVLRPMMSQAGQLGAIPNTNKLVLVDRYDNVRRITAVIEEIVSGFDD